MIISIDPGKVSGVAVWSPEDRAFTAFEYDVLDTIEFVTAAYKLTRELARPFPGIEIVSEKFTISERTIKTALSLDALDINGWLTIQCQRWGVPYKQQTPAQAKSFATDDKLKALDWYERTKDGHANDAARHLVVYLWSEHRDMFNQHLLPSLAKDILK